MSVRVTAARQAALHRVASTRRHLGEPACAIGSLGIAVDGALGGQSVAWFNHRLVELCDVSSNIGRAIQARDIFAAPDSLVYLSAETAASYRRGYELVEEIEIAFLRGEATEAEGSGLVISKLGRASVCLWVLTIIPMPDGGMPEGLLALWPLTPEPYSPLSPMYPAPPGLLVLKAKMNGREAELGTLRWEQQRQRLTPPQYEHQQPHEPHQQYEQQEAHQREQSEEEPPVQSRALQSSPPPSAPAPLISSFKCHKGWNVWHPYSPKRRGGVNVSTT